MAHRPFKQRLYPLFARIGQALASDRRLELLDLLAQCPRHVEALAAETDMSVASVSQHLQVLRNARLVETARDGTKVVYRLAGDDVLRLWLALRGVAEARLPEIGLLLHEHHGEGGEVADADLAKLARDGSIVLIDVRPTLEFQSGHIPGALSLPLHELPQRLDTLPADKQIVAYCRGAYCLLADDAVALLRARGYDAIRLDHGWLEWRGRRPASAPKASARAARTSRAEPA
jgi:rhodanese-related sulfurtransferase